MPRRIPKKVWIAIPVFLVLFFLFALPRILSWSGTFLVAAEEPAKAEVIIVLAGDFTGQRVIRGATLAREGFAPLVLVSGPGRNYDRNEADLAIEFAVHRGYPESYFEPVHHRAHSTYEEALNMIAHVRKKGFRRVLLVTSDFHTRRAGRIYRRLAPDFDIRVVAAPTPGFEPSYWWLERESSKTWLYEWQKTVADMLPDA
ncbi:MAG: YdcF family protein [Bryobacteraceae bacterium]|nr:YdcF family protein [Bryobacteraceae bacterium]